MARTITAAVVGAILGTLIAVALHSGRPDREALAAAVDSVPVDAARSVLAPASVPQGEGTVAEGVARLTTMRSPAERRAAALALVEAADADQAAIGRIGAALPPADRLTFTFDAIARVALRDLDAALRLALELEDQAARTEAVVRTARAVAAHDPNAVLAAADSIGAYELRTAYVSSLFQQLASVDIDGFFALVAAHDSNHLPFTAEVFESLASLAAIDAERVLAEVDKLPLVIRATARLEAVRALVRNDPDAAFRHVELAPETERNRLLVSAAREFALHDADAALAWLAAQRRPGVAMVGVLQGIAEIDPVRAADLLIETLAGGGSDLESRLDSVMASFKRAPPEHLVTVADRLSLARGASEETAFASFLRSWSQEHPEAAHFWASTHVDRLTEGVLFALLRDLAPTRRDLAKEAVTWMPAELFDRAVRTVGGELARADAADALRWLERFEDRDFYARAVQTAIDAAATSTNANDPEVLAAFLDDNVPEARANLLPTVADAWARRDGAAAARWVASAPLSDADERRRTAAYHNVASRWAERDPDAAREWALGMPRGEERDDVLSTVVHAFARAGRIDTQLLAAFSTDDARQSSLANALPSLGQTDPERARRLIVELVTDPQHRARAEAELVRGNWVRPGLTLREEVIFR